jgi:hypothetical protein
VATAAEPWQAMTAMVAIATMAVTAPSTLPAPAPVVSPRAAAVEIPDDDVPPPGWDQWASLPTSALEPPAGALVRREDDRVTAGHLERGAEASLSHAALPASGGHAASPERERERVDMPPAHFAEAQAEQELWQELRDHSASLNRALNEALWIHSGQAWRVFRVRSCSLNFVFFPLLPLRPYFS